MKELLKTANEFLVDNPWINEIELSDLQGNKVHLVRNTPAPTNCYTIATDLAD